MQCTLTWKAVYNDGTIIEEKDVDTTEKIDRDKLKEFRMFDGDKLVFAAFFNPYKKLIFRRRVFSDATGNVKGVVYLVGWHEKIKDVSTKSICYIYEDGHVEFDDARNDIEIVPCEEF